MSRQTARHLPIAPGKTFNEKHSALVKEEEFARRLNELMLERGYRQSDLAKRIWGTTTDPRTGYEVAKGRDRISAYVNAKQFPDPTNLRALAEALEVSEAELAPELAVEIIERRTPEWTAASAPGHDGVLFEMKKIIPLDLYVEFVRLLAENDARMPKRVPVTLKKTERRPSEEDVIS